MRYANGFGGSLGEPAVGLETWGFPFKVLEGLPRRSPGIFDIPTNWEPPGIPSQGKFVVLFEWLDMF